MKPEFSPHQLKKTKPSEYLLRFAFGGVVSVAAGLVTHLYGPVVGGLFLAFPAILPASLTLIKQHDGRRAAADDARGAVLGAVGMSCFALVVWAGADWPSAVLTLLAALAIWLGVSVSAWWLVLKRPDAAAQGHERCRPGAENDSHGHHQSQ